MQIESLPETHTYWPGWANFLRHRHMDGLVAWALEAAGPLTVIGAQFLYLGWPVLRPAFSNQTISALAGVLEDKSEITAFVAFLREGDAL